MTDHTRPAQDDDDRCQACHDGYEGVPYDNDNQRVWRTPTSFEDVRSARAAGVAVHDSDGDCVDEVSQNGGVAPDRLTYTLTYTFDSIRYATSIKKLSIYTPAEEAPSDEEVAAALATITASIKETS